MKNDVLTQVQPVKLPMRVKLLFGMGSFANTMLVIATMSFLLYFYTDVLGIRSEVAATIILIAKIWDIINDPMMGVICDRTRSKEGKCRFWLKYMSVPGGIIVALLFCVPELSEGGKIAWVAITYVLQGMVNTALGIPSNTLIGRITSDLAERATLNQIRGYYSVAANLLIGSGTMPLVMVFGQGNMRKGFMILSIICGVIYAVGYLVTYFVTKGYEPLEYLAEESTDMSETPAQKASVWQMLKALGSNTPWVFCAVFYLLDMIGSSLANSALIYYFQYNLGDSQLLLFSAISGFLLIPAFLANVFLKPIVKKFGNSGGAVLGSLICALGLGLRFVLHDANTAILTTGMMLVGFGTGLAGACVILCVFDAKVYGEWKTGVDNEAVLMSGYSASYKIGQALGQPILGYMMAAVPYVAASAVQDESVLELFFNASSLIPAIIFLVGAVLAMALRKYEKKVPAMREEIAARNNH